MALFISEDTYKGTLGNTQSQNLYTYVHNNPLIYSDPSGHNGLGGPGWNDELNRILGIEPIDDFEASMGIINFLILDDLSTIVDPNSSTFEKIVAGASITPFGKIVKIGGKLFKIGSKGSDEAGYFAKGAGKVGLKSLDDFPENVQNTYSQYNKSGWKGNVPGQSAGTKAGGGYQNSNGALPTTDAAGKPITYKEFDVNNKLPNSGRDAERFISGSDGSIYYIDSHYGDIQSPTGLPSFVKVK